jgi:hypothetical protein
VSPPTLITGAVISGRSGDGLRAARALLCLVVLLAAATCSCTAGAVVDRTQRLVAAVSVKRVTSPSDLGSVNPQGHQRRLRRHAAAPLVRSGAARARRARAAGADQAPIRAGGRAAEAILHPWSSDPSERSFLRSRLATSEMARQVLAYPFSLDDRVALFTAAGVIGTLASEVDVDELVASADQDAARRSMTC